MPRFARKEKEIVNAHQAQSAVRMLTPAGEVQAQAGDWIVDANRVSI